MKSLAFPEISMRQINSLANAKKATLVAEAVGWKGCSTQGEYIDYDIWNSSDGHSRVTLRKYGKEYYGEVRWKDGHREHNPNDMRPSLFLDNEEIVTMASFDDIFKFLQEMYEYDREVAQLMGCLLYRDAYLLDHVHYGSSYRYEPPKDVISYMNEKMKDWKAVTPEAYLRYLDIIAWNEDVKYWSIGFDITKGTGRTNNLLTYAHLLSVLMGTSSLSKLCGSFSRPPIGVSPIPKKDAADAFPQLWPDNDSDYLVL